MLKKVPSQHVYALSSWTIKQDGENFYICRTGTGGYGRKYMSLRHACMGIARKLEEEFARRKSRVVAFQGGQS